MKITDTKVMLKVINLRKRPGTFLKKLFFGKSKTHSASEMIVDVKSGKREMAPFVSPRVGGKIVERSGFTTRKISVPKIAPERLTTVDDVSTLQPGENEFSTKTPKQRQQKILVDDLSELDDQIIRREEWMTREVILKKHVQIKGDGVDKDVKFDEDDSLVLSGTSLWSHVDSDPLAFLKAQQRLITKATGIRPKVLVLDGDAGEAFQTHAKVKEAFNSRHIILGELKPTIKDDNVTFVGKITALGLEVYIYEEWFIDDDGIEQPYLPIGTVILGSKNLGVMNYGAVKQMEKGNFVLIEEKRVPKYVVDENNETTKLRLSSKPLPTPRDTKAWRTITVL